jgi:hypothetical protein
MKTLALVVLAGAMFLGGCGNSDRAARLTSLAAGEASSITKPRDRLQWQLNIAEMQNRHLWFQDARVNLATARKTIESCDRDQLTDLDRIAGWVSISELSRVADDHDGAVFACQNADKSLRTIEPEAKRCEYVRGLATEFYALGDRRSAIDLLKQAGGWAKSIQETQYRRLALTVITNDLFGWNEYDAGRDVLRQDDDAGWRTQTLLALAAAEDQRFYWAHTDNTIQSKMAPSFGKQVDYKSNYQQALDRQQSTPQQSR